MIAGRLSWWQGSLAELIYPRVCSFCDGTDPISPDFCICDSCAEAIQEIAEPLCEICGLPVPGLRDGGARSCGRCLSNPPAFGRARYGLRYKGAVRDAVVRFKYAGFLYVGRTLSELFVQAFERHFDRGEFDLIIPVPVHGKRLIRRGFNQSVILAERLSFRTTIPLDRVSLRKTKDTIPQVGLPKKRRTENLRNSFGISRPERIRGRRILLIDDVATTGSTIAEASRALIRGKASRVDALVLAVNLEPLPRSGSTNRNEHTSEP